MLVLHEGWVTGNLVAAREARDAGVPYIVMPHGVYDPDWRRYLKPPRVVREAFERSMLEKARAVHVFFRSEAFDIQRIAPAARFVVVPTGFSRAVPQWTGGGGYLSWVGRYDPHHKGLDLLVDAVSLLSVNERPRVVLHGYDYMGGMEQLRAYVARAGVRDWIEVEGAVTGESKMDFLRKSDGYLHPSRWECHSMALLENLAIGVPSVVSGSIHIAGLLDRRRAALIAQPDPESVAAGMLALPGRRDELAESARRLVEAEFAWPNLVPRFLDELARVGLH
ncbi:hypothetical protein BH23CHL7_BH23CHL7_06630 [soil metagenome]